jgi:hypothetical protein
MRTAVLGIALASGLPFWASCNEDGHRDLAPDTQIDDQPAAITNQAHVRIAFHAIGTADQLTCQLDDQAPVFCTSPFEADVTDGEHTFQVAAAIRATRDTTPATATWRVDTVPPDTAIVSGPPALDNALDPELVFDGTDAQGTVVFECALDGAAFAPCTSPARPAISDGSHSYLVRAVDLAGNRDPSPAMLSWVVDSTAPDTAISVGPAAGSTTAAAVSFQFGSPDNPVTLECSLDGAAFAACTSPASFTLGSGPHTFSVRARDPLGLVDPSPATRAWTVDATPPAVAITATPGNPTNDATGTFSFSSPDGTATFACRVDGGGFAACTPGFTTASLTDGSHTFTVRASDPVGNTSTAAFTWSIDTVAPAVAVTNVATPTNDATPGVAFTVSGATTIQCRVDAGSFATCTSPFTPAALTNGSHTVTVRGSDTAGNVGSDATTFTVDTVAPPVVFDDAPPAEWPVHYFEMRFRTTDTTATLACSLNGAAFTACASPLTVTTSYDVGSTFSVRATDPAGNSSTGTRSWTSSDGLVLHYPWEQGQTHNTSLLAQNAAFSPDGTTSVPIVGGWAGTAAGSPRAHAYAGTIRPLSSSATGGYTASVWVRSTNDASGTILSTLAANNGFSLAITGRQVTLRVNQGGDGFTTTAAVPPDVWVQLGVRTTGPGSGLSLLVNGAVVSTASPPASTGFGAGQARDLTVGPVSGVDLDDLRFYNRALSSSELCTVLVRGQLGAQGLCVPLIPGFELDFENNVIRDTGSWNLTLTPPQEIQFVPTRLGSGLRLSSIAQQFAYSGFASNVNQAPGHSFSFWFVAGASSTELLLDFLHPCAAGAPFTCGIRVIHSVGSGLQIIASGGGATPFARTFNVPSGPHSVVVTEQKAPGSATTQSLTIYIDGVASVLPIGTGNVYGNPSDAVLLPRQSGTSIDEYEFWPRDLSLDPEMLCENGWDGEWNPASDTCLLTSNGAATTLSP